jgi:outer membrane protein TolC
VLEAERRLRYVIGLPAEDGTRLLPTDAPAVASHEPDWNGALADAMARRPEIAQIRQEIRATQLAILKAKDGVMPDLRFLSRLEANGLGGTLGSSFRSLGQDPYPSWELGLQLQVPIGFREGHSQLTRVRLQLAQRYAFLRDQEEKVLSSLQRSYRDLVQFREEVRTRHSQRESVAKLLQARYDKFKAGKGTTEFLMQAQRSWADALRDEYSAICSYNIALADFERQKGTIMDYDNVALKEAPIPGCVSRASEHIRAASRSRTPDKSTTSTDRAVRADPDQLDYRQPPALPCLHLDEEPR